MSLTDEQIEQGQRYLSVWRHVTSRPMASHVVEFARAIESAACVERDKRIAEFVNALDEEMVVSHIGVFKTTDDPRKAIKDLMLWSQGVGEYFAAEKAKERIAEMEEMNAQLRGQNTAVDKACADLEAHIEQLERELGTVRKDAERYRWLRDESQWLRDVPQAIIWRNDGHAQVICAEEELDEAIDAAKEKP
jgi:hypothetical protein